MNTAIFENIESNVRSYCRSFPTVFTKAKGAVMTDENGKNYIDFFAGAGALNYGHNPDLMMERAIRYLQEGGILHSMDMYTPAKREFLEHFQEQILNPRGLNYRIQFAGPTGTNAVEAAIKLARMNKGRENIFAFMGAFHGMTFGSLALTTDRCSRDAAGQSLPNVTHIPAPYMFPGFDTIAYMERLLTDDHSGVEKPAAIILETVQADGGIYVFEENWLRDLRELCDRHDILLIVDDVQVGNGRTGTFFSFERAGIQPDMVTLSKSIGGIGMPMALLLIRPDRDIWKPAEHNGTFRGNQLAFVAGKAAIEYMVEHRLDEQAARKGKMIEQFIRNEILPMDKRLTCRGIGMMWGIDCTELGADAFSEAIIEHCFDRKLILERAGRGSSVVKLMPTLVIEDDVLLKGLNIVKEAFALELNKA